MKKEIFIHFPDKENVTSLVRKHAFSGSEHLHVIVSDIIQEMCPFPPSLWGDNLHTCFLLPSDLPNLLKSSQVVEVPGLSDVSSRKQTCEAQKIFIRNLK